EHQIQDEIRIALSKHGCTIFRSNAGQVTTIEGRQFYGMPKGFPDLCGHRNSDGKAIYIEVKNERGKLREDQKRFAEFLNGQPVLYGVARSVEEALKIVEESS
ncbi:TPA: VRR-NUC domain-containing protein, partial [Enterococcus faecium]